jgi:signal transduction histidine kinase
LAELAQEFNRMAEQLEAGRDRATREAEERLQLERRLRETEKLASVGNLATSIAHEIAAPLNVVSGRAQMLRKQETTAAARDRNIAIITDQIGRITLIVRNLLDFARRREPRLEPIDVGQVLDTVVEFLEGEFEASSIRLVREGPGSAWVQGDADLLQQVFSNLLLNALQALQATEQEGRITVCIRPPHAARNVVVIDVADNGPGIPEDLLPQVFEPFVTTKRDRTGTGLGLAVARSIVEEHGGRLEAWNRSAARASGAVFRLVLPAASAPEV